jgi:phage terminase large subunit-like protein
VKQWTTSCPDWEQRIVEGRSLIPFDPLFPEEAEAALAIMRDLRIVDMPNSPRRKEVCRRWIFDLAAALFGSYDTETGIRLIQYYFLLISKKNDKSGTAAALMITALMRNWRTSGEFYILAPSKETADNAFRPAADMIRADEDLLALLHVQDNLKTITHRITDATLKVVSDEVVAGKKTIGLLVEELWEFGKRSASADMLREVQGGLASRPEGFVIYLSTQSDAPPAGVFKQKLHYFRDVRDGKVTDPNSLPILYEFPPDYIEQKLYLKRENWHITNPNLGASVREHFLVERLVEAERAGPSEVNGFLAKHLNVEIGMALRADGWAGAKLWDRGIETGLTLEAILKRSEVVTVGFDGGGLDDLFGMGVIGRERDTKRWLGWAHALISPEGMERRKANATIYQQFIEDGDLTLIENLPDDLTHYVGLVKLIVDSGLLAQVGVDAAGIGALVDALAEIGVTQDAEKLGAIRQGIALMGAIKTIERKLIDGTFRHKGGAMMAWCASNAIIVPTPTAMRIDRAESGFGKIDPLMALFNAASLMALNPKGNMLPKDYRIPVIG